ncbi:hypothetical protein cyc_07819 [Cyclospora cayetanensis]|uniref:Uncharacterized protein n=1 Tax=Cyclospora cayetanensis TaxID=88456 RepID=A0A1D3D233_9EIME|nr:hypothetical protein cyc_07819 [Cyclospora cayetanensis]
MPLHKMEGEQGSLRRAKLLQQLPPSLLQHVVEQLPQDPLLLKVLQRRGCDNFLEARFEVHPHKLQQGDSQDAVADLVWYSRRGSMRLCIPRIPSLLHRILEHFTACQVQQRLAQQRQQDQQQQTPQKKRLLHHRDEGQQQDEQEDQQKQQKQQKRRCEKTLKRFLLSGRSTILRRVPRAPLPAGAGTRGREYYAAVRGEQVHAPLLVGQLLRVDACAGDGIFAQIRLWQLRLLLRKTILLSLRLLLFKVWVRGSTAKLLQQLPSAAGVAGVPLLPLKLQGQLLLLEAGNAAEGASAAAAALEASEKHRAAWKHMQLHLASAAAEVTLAAAVLSDAAAAAAESPVLSGRRVSAGVVQSAAASARGEAAAPVGGA